MNVAMSGHLTVARPPAEAFGYFTPRGEQRWVPEWRPRFPVPTGDDTAPGTVFETDAHGRTTTWVVVERTAASPAREAAPCGPRKPPALRIRYARVVPGDTAGTVTVELADDGGHSDVTVTYELTALSASAAESLRGFAARYPEMLRNWAEAIAASLEAEPVAPRT